MYGRLKGDNMNKQEIIDSSLFGVEINSREIDLKPTRAFDCFLIVNRTTDDEYIIKQLIRLIFLGRKYLDGKSLSQIFSLLLYFSLL